MRDELRASSPREQISDRFTILRSVAHTGGGHPAGSLQLLSGDADAQDKLKPIYPDFMSVAHHHLGIDYEKVTLPDGTGRPVHIVQNGKAIPELLSTV